MSDNQLQEHETQTVTTINQQEDNNEDTANQITPLRCFSGAAISGGLSVGSYFLAKSVILTYVDMPIKFNNPMAANIASTVRTLIMGITTLATFLFLMVTIGLFALGIKLIFTNNEVKS